MAHDLPPIPWIVSKLGVPESVALDFSHVFSALFVLTFLAIVSLIANRQIRKALRNPIPDQRPTASNFFDATIEAILSTMQGIMGPSAEKHLPLIASCFIYILTCNLLSVLPGFVPPTDNINTNLACALTVFCYYNYVGISENGLVKYLKHMGGPILWLAPLMFLIETISHLVRPLSLSVRLFGNMIGDHMVLGMFQSMAPLLVPVIFLFLSAFVAFIQAFVFSLLSVIYISLAEGKLGQDH